MSDLRQRFVVERDGQLLLKWAMRYSPHPKCYQRIVERTAMMAAMDLCASSQEGWEQHVKALMHQVAQDELLKAEPSLQPFPVLLRGARVMVVEDEYCLADELSNTLQASGAELVGPCPNLESGLAAIKVEQIDVAILDIRLEGLDCYPIADELTRRDIPFVFLSGYERDVLPERYKQVRHYLKPIPTSEVPALLSLYLSENRI